MDKLLAVFDADSIYTIRFLEYFKKNRIPGFEITVFTEPESLQEFLKYQKAEILLLGDGLQASEVAKDSIKYIFCLKDRDDAGLVKDEYRINKYQSAGRVLSDLLSLYTRLENDTVMAGSGNTHIISVFAPVPGISKTLFAWSLAAGLSEKRKVLFLPLELFPVPDIHAAMDEAQSLSEYLYYLKENNPNLFMKMKQNLKFTGKLSYLSGIAHGFDLLSLNKEDAMRWAEELRAHMDYGAIVFYLGFYSEATLEIMVRSDEVYIVSEENSYEKEVRKEWERQMASLDIHTGQKKFKYLSLPEELQPEAGEGPAGGLQDTKIRQIAMQCADSLFI